MSSGDDQILSDDVHDTFSEMLRSGSSPASDTTVERYNYEVEKWARWLRNKREKDVWQAKTSDLRRHLRMLQSQDYADTTITIRRSAISQFYQQLQKAAVDLDLPFCVPENPEVGLKNDDDWTWSSGATKKSEGIREEDTLHYLGPDEISQLVTNVPAPKLRNALVVKLLFDTGMRRGELAQVRLDDINRDRKSIYVPPIKSPLSRTVTYTPDYVNFELEQWVDRGYREATHMAGESDYLFPTDESEHISGYRINSVVTEAAENAGLQETVAEYAGNDARKIRKVTSHTIRHSHAVQAIKSDIDVRRLAESMGHKSEDGEVNLETTMVYLKMAEKDYVDESRNFNPHG